VVVKVNIDILGRQLCSYGVKNLLDQSIHPVL
jgi:hypothetical protein